VIQKLQVSFVFASALAKTAGKSFQCLCDSTHSKFIPPQAIQSVRLNQRGPRCQNVEIISTSPVNGNFSQVIKFLKYLLNYDQIENRKPNKNHQAH
uniref:Chemokine interleukin-8-like domain-containing protein n=1 Tax=Strigops habroptila TaxID=2489341 RepID=A0A672UYC4_STRHB